MLFKGVFSSLLAFGLVMSLMVTGNAKEVEVKVLYESKMKSEQVLLQDALLGKKDDGLNVIFESDLEVNKSKDKHEAKKHYTIQKLREVQRGNQQIASFVVLAVAEDPTDYDERDPRENPGSNFRQTIWAWYDTYTNSSTLVKYAKATRYEARWDLLDSNRLTIKDGEFTSVADGFTPSNYRLAEKSPSNYYPPVWGKQYVKLPTWDYINISGGGYVGGKLVTNYTAGSTSAKLQSTVRVD